jgi:hypothetical protein
MSKVKVVPFLNGQLTNASKSNPEKVFFRVESVETTINNGQINSTKRTATVQGTKAQVAEMGIYAGMELAGKIVVTESLTPFYEGQEPKLAGATGVVCTLDGAPIYRNSTFESDMSKVDTLIAHNNNAEIKSAQEALKAKSEFQG